MIVSFTVVSCADLPVPEKPQVPAETMLLAAASDFTTGTLSAITLNDIKPYPDLLPLHSDAIVYTEGNNSFILNRLGADNVVSFSVHENFHVSYEVSIGQHSNPASVAVISASMAAVALAGKNHLTIINPANGESVQQVDLSKWADADGLPETSAVFYKNGFLYVALQRLNRHVTGSSTWPPVGDSYLLKIDTSDFSIIKEFVTPFTNPAAKFTHYSGRNSIVVAAPGNFGVNYQLDGGLIEYDLDTDSFLTSPLTEAQAGFEITHGVIVSETLGFVIGSDASQNSILAAFDPQSHAIIKIIATHSFSTGGYFSDFIVHNNRLYLADRNSTNPGVRIFDTTSLTEITSTPVSTGLPPFSLAVFNP